MPPKLLQRIVGVNTFSARERKSPDKLIGQARKPRKIMGKTVREGFGTRLYEAMLEAGHVKRKGHLFGPDIDALMARVGVTREAARRYLKGISLPDPERLQPLAEWCGVNISWLRDGIGPKHGTNGVNPEDALQTDQERQLIRLFRQGKPDERDQMVRLAQVLLKKDGGVT